ncbi:MAG: DUF2062 domain-containing protein [Nanoarchaeota archaeon]|nr:DUF2062 domain-containing protein [Nanoarchaeota archaeon]
MIKKFRDKIKKHLSEVLELKTSPHSIAMGFALGTFIAILPTFGLGAFIGLFFIMIFKKISKVSMFISFAIWNPLVLAFLTTVEYGIGDLIYSDLPIIYFKFEIFNKIFLFTRRILIGSIVLATTISIICYILIWYFSKKYQKKRFGSVGEELSQVGEVLKI